VRIVDAHQHLGRCRVFDADVAAEDLLGAMDAHGVAVALVMPFPGAADAANAHDAIAGLARRSGDRIRGIALHDPHVDPANYAAEAERCVEHLGFVALKLHTVGHAVEPLSRDGRHVAATAARLGVPLMVHTGGVGTPFASPSHCLPLARAHPDMPVVLAHAGMGVATQEAAVVAAEAPNVYLETSWCSVLDTRALLDQFGPSRVMLGADAVENIPVELAKYRALGLSDDELAECLGGTASRVFAL
jgi:predicted TIM-barrel fold metal-dependent hydrolase